VHNGNVQKISLRYEVGGCSGGSGGTPVYAGVGATRPKVAGGTLQPRHDLEVFCNTQTKGSEVTPDDGDRDLWSRRKDHGPQQALTPPDGMGAALPGERTPNLPQETLEISS